MDVQHHKGAGMPRPCMGSLKLLAAFWDLIGGLQVLESATLG